jgi:hypothetical protein
MRLMKCAWCLCLCVYITLTTFECLNKSWWYLVRMSVHASPSQQLLMLRKSPHY